MLSRLRAVFMPVANAVGKAWRWFSDCMGGTKIELSRFDQVLQTERDAINERRRKIAEENPGGKRRKRRSRDVPQLSRPLLPPVHPQSKKGEPIAAAGSSTDIGGVEGGDGPAGPRGPDALAADRPRPRPCDAVGIALSGGGIRSAAFSIGALQALEYHHVLDSADYLSTVSGGGYAGSSMSAGMSVTIGQFPFGGAGDIRDNAAIGHIRNYSNYLIPRAYSGLRNALDVAAILLRGLIANGVVVLTFLLSAAVITSWVYPSKELLKQGSFLPRLAENLGAVVAWLGSLTGLGNYVSRIWSLIGPEGFLKWIYAQISIADWFEVSSSFRANVHWLLFELPFGFTLLVAALLVTVLLIWTIRRSISTWAVVPRAIGWLVGRIQRYPRLARFVGVQPGGAVTRWAFRRTMLGTDGNDVDSPLLRNARRILGLTIISAILDSLPLLVYGLSQINNVSVKAIFSLGPASAISVTLALFARRLAAFLETTKLSKGGTIRLMRLLTQIAFVVGGLIVPVALVIIYLHFTAWALSVPSVNNPFPITVGQHILQAFPTFMWMLAILVPIVLIFEANAYSLHQFYKDRLSKAFLFSPNTSGPDGEPLPLTNYKLSQITTDYCPYHIINAALNVQGSREANRRGRNADFFTFTRDFIGSDLTLFARTRADGPVPTPIMERVDTRLDLGSAMAISGAALSANMGSNTVRWLSPTLALLNIRLGYWLRNPRHLASLRWDVIRPLQDFIYRILGKFFLLVEMFNFLHENSPFVYLTDGGHIENLGIYQLLKRGCRLIIAIDAEADPEISCASLLKVERYARIDLGVRIILPWESIARRNRETNVAVDPATPEEAQRHHGPHCAIGRILYEDGAQGILLYFKSSLSGDEKDYLLDYKKRNRNFPHETTGDQFFTEEQFEVYRALGYHVVEGYFYGNDEIAWLQNAHGAWTGVDDAKQELRRALGWRGR